mmetsp:Transcript_71514/g.165365  ORF Transcript_71514/g.165365 Transcript_71514/m.165365 type:complete len:478 (+) Transcript_71514:88-1521(+)
MPVCGFTTLELRTYLVLSLCWLSIVQVNLLEQPYARSLVTCDTPVNTTEGAPFSGSRFCGDRLHVINVGAEISGVGQSLENVGRILICLFVSGWADRGRRRAAILGQSLILLSTVLFFLAGFASSLALPLYAVAQGLQGMSGIGILDQIVTGDVALRNGDSVGVYRRKGMFVMCMGIVFAPLVGYVQFAEFSDFTWIWLAVNLLNLTALGLLAAVFPETLQAEPAEEVGLMRTVVKELRTFRDLVKSNLFVRYRLADNVAAGMCDATSIIFPFLMAHFGFSQFQALVVCAGPALLLGPVFFQLVPYLHKRMGYRQASLLCFWVNKLVTLWFLAGLPGLGNHPMLMKFWSVPGPIAMALSLLPLNGWPTILAAIEIRLVGQANNAKYQAINQLTGFACGFASSFVYSRLFDAEATTTAGKVLPYYFSCAWLLVQLLLFCCGSLEPMLLECDKITSEEAEELVKAEAAPAVEAESKKVQ